MKKKITGIICILAVIFAACAAWLLTPKQFLHGTVPADVAGIYVFDGNTGHSFTITDADSISYIVENVQKEKMKRTGISLGYSGYRFRLEFVDRNGKRICRFNLNSPTAIRKDPFFYEITGDVEENSDPLCYEYIEAAENSCEKEMPRTEAAENGSAKAVPQENEAENEPLQAEAPEKEETPDAAVLDAMVMVDGKLYVDTGENSTVKARCGVMDGGIDSSVEADEKPTKDNQSNFGVGYGFQYMGEDTIEVYMDEQWRVFRAEK